MSKPISPLHREAAQKILLELETGISLPNIAGLLADYFPITLDSQPEAEKKSLGEIACSFFITYGKENPLPNNWTTINGKCPELIAYNDAQWQYAAQAVASAATREKDEEIGRLKKSVADANKGAERNARINLSFAKKLNAKYEEIRRLREALKDVEWSAVRRVAGATYPACPCCYSAIPSARHAALKGDEHFAGPITEAYADSKFGHLPKCNLAAALDAAKEGE